MSPLENVQKRIAEECSVEQNIEVNSIPKDPKETTFSHHHIALTHQMNVGSSSNTTITSGKNIIKIFISKIKLICTDP